VTDQAHDSSAPALADAEMLAAQRQRARRGAVLLGIVALLTYVGFILATSLRH
jgi:uncharacterized membrane protein (DUF485 family)